MDILGKLLGDTFSDGLIEIVFTVWLVILISLTLRATFSIIRGEIRTMRNSLDTIKEGKVGKNREDVFDVLINLTTENPNDRDTWYVRDNGGKEWLPETPDNVADFGMKRYNININRYDGRKVVTKGMDIRREKENMVLHNQIKDAEYREYVLKSKKIEEDEYISYVELYVIYKGLEKMYRDRMRDHLNNLENDLIKLKGRIERGGVSKENSKQFMNAYRGLLREVELYRKILEHNSLVNRLNDIDRRLRQLGKKHPFLVYGFEETTKYKEPKGRRRRKKPIYKGD